MSAPTVRAMDGSIFTTVDGHDGSVRQWVRFRGARLPLLVDADTFERIAAGLPTAEYGSEAARWQATG
jgi:hypothetical protein